MNSKNCIKKGKLFYQGIVLNLIEGLFSSFNFMILYTVMKILWNDTVTIPVLLKLSLGLGIIFVFRLIIYSTGYVTSQIGGAHVSRKIRLFLGDKMKKIPLVHLHKGQIGQYVDVVTKNVNDYEKILTHKIGDLVKNISLSIMLIVFVGTIWVYGGILLFVVNLTLFPLSLMTSLVVKKYGAQKTDASTENVTNIVEYITGIQTLKAYGMVGQKNKKLIAIMKNFTDISFIYECKCIPLGVLQRSIIWLSLPLMIWAASSPWFMGDFDSIAYLLLCMMPLFLSKLTNTIFIDLLSYQNLSVSKKKMLEVMNEAEDRGNNTDFSPSSYDISFNGVDFSYLQGEIVLKNASFAINGGTLTAIVGDSGSGKSTILNLISKYYEPNSGKIKIGERTIQDFKAEKVLKYISMVDQDVFLFNDTVKNNIRYASPNATDIEVEIACKKANCHEFIQKLKDGYDTEIGENGNRLSGGERQRLSIARAILKDSPIILLDESTSSLDIENELAVRKAIINLLRQNKTVIMIAHTLSIIKQADQILVVNKGTIVEAGVHDALLARGGKYFAMWCAEQHLSG